MTLCTSCGEEIQDLYPENKEISDLKAKNKELETARNNLFNEAIYLLDDRQKLLDALDELKSRHEGAIYAFAQYESKEALQLDLKLTLHNVNALITKYRR